MFKALVIGCGNIGAMYDFDNNEVQTHVKALLLSPHFSLSIYDQDKYIERKIHEKYSCKIVEKISCEILESFDCISICTPTQTHYYFLEMAIKAKVKLIICEKPISYNISEINKIKNIYRGGGSKVLVNYIRRFQPAYKKLKDYIYSVLEDEIITNITIRYQRGFINNCSHAIDLIQFLTDSEITFNDVNISNLVYDYNSYDPTVSLQASWSGINICIVGLSNVCFSYFEIDIYFKYEKVHIKNSGNDIEIYKAGKSQFFFQPLVLSPEYTQNNCLHDYMENVIDFGYQLLTVEEAEDNMTSSLDLNEKMINTLNI